jgi:microcystin-dependent protein
MSNPYLGEIRLFAFDFAPKGWARCAGQTLSINQNQALFSLLGVQFGGDGVTTFALPDLRDRAPVHVDLTGGTNVIGGVGGEATHTLTVNEMPAHAHAVSARPSASTGDPTNALWATSTNVAYDTHANTTMADGAGGVTGAGQSHDNMPPYLTMAYAIALVGIFPPRN